MYTEIKLTHQDTFSILTHPVTYSNTCSTNLSSVAVDICRNECDIVGNVMCHNVWQREEAVQRVHREAERKRQERELLKIQEEQERLQRKKVLLFSVHLR